MAIPYRSPRGIEVMALALSFSLKGFMYKPEYSSNRPLFQYQLIEWHTIGGFNGVRNVLFSDGRVKNLIRDVRVLDRFADNQSDPPGFANEKTG
jgi:hypothetical protein